MQKVQAHHLIKQICSLLMDSIIIYISCLIFLKLILFGIFPTIVCLKW